MSPDDDEQRDKPARAARLRLGKHLSDAYATGLRSDGPICHLLHSRHRPSAPPLSPRHRPAGATVPPGLVVPDRMCVMGVPGKIVRPVKEKELEYMRWLASHYVELAGKYVRGEIGEIGTTNP